MLRTERDKKSSERDLEARVRDIQEGEYRSMVGHNKHFGRRKFHRHYRSALGNGREPEPAFSRNVPIPT